MVATSSTINATAPKPANALAIRLGLKFNLSEVHGIKRLFSSKPSDGPAPYLPFAANSHPLIIQPPTAISRQSGSSVTDAEIPANEFDPEFSVQVLVNLPNCHVYLKMMIEGRV